VSEDVKVRSQLDRWMKDQSVSSVRLLDCMREVDPSAQGVCRRSLFNYRRKGLMDLRSLILLVAASQRLAQSGEIQRPLELSDFDQWGIFQPPEGDVTSLESKST